MIETHKSFLGIKYDCKKIKQWQPLEIKIINQISHTIKHKIMNFIDSTDIIVDMLDPTGVSVSKWVLKNCVIKSMDFGNGKYGEKTVNLVSVTVQPETCVLEYC